MWGPQGVDLGSSLELLWGCQEPLRAVAQILGVKGRGRAGEICLSFLTWGMGMTLPSSHGTAIGTEWETR